MTDEDRCPACGLPVPTVTAFQAHLRATARDEPHIAALQAEERGARLRRARERGWRLL